MKKMIYDDGELRLRVVIPIAFDQSSPSSPDCSLKSSECSCCEDHHHRHHYNSVDSEALEDSDCTEEEKVALEQLVELRRSICCLSSQEDPDDYSAVTTPCATEGSFNICKGSLQQLPLPPPSCTSEGLPTASSSADFIFNFCKLKHNIQEQPSPQQDEQDNIRVNIVDMIATTSGDSQALHHHDCSFDSLDSQFDERPNPRTRLLSDIYHDKIFSSFSLPNKKVKWRRKALNKIMEMGF